MTQFPVKRQRNKWKKLFAQFEHPIDIIRATLEWGLRLDESSSLQWIKCITANRKKAETTKNMCWKRSIYLLTLKDFTARWKWNPPPPSLVCRQEVSINVWGCWCRTNSSFLNRGRRLRSHRSQEGKRCWRWCVGPPNLESGASFTPMTADSSLCSVKCVFLLIMRLVWAHPVWHIVWRK